MWANMFLAGRQLLAPGARVPLRAVWSRSLRTSQPACSSQEPRGEPAPARKVRPSKTAAKRGAQQWQKLASQLCQLSDRQLVSLRPLLDDRAVEAVLEAKGISGRSQARNRQEAFIAKVLREELDEEQQRLLEVCEGVRAQARVHRGNWGKPLTELAPPALRRLAGS